MCVVSLTSRRLITRVHVRNREPLTIIPHARRSVTNESRSSTVTHTTHHFSLSLSRDSSSLSYASTANLSSSRYSFKAEDTEWAMKWKAVGVAQRLKRCQNGGTVWNLLSSVKLHAVNFSPSDLKFKFLGIHALINSITLSSHREYQKESNNRS